MQFFTIQTRFNIMENNFNDYKKRVLEDHSEKSRDELEQEALQKLQEAEDLIVVMHLKAFPQINEMDLVDSVYTSMQDALLNKFIDGNADLDKRMEVLKAYLNDYRRENEKEREFLKNADLQEIREVYGFHQRGNEDL